MREWLVRSFFVGNRQTGLTGWSVPLDALRESFEYASGTAQSRSTFNRVLNALEAMGDIRRQKCRLGNNRFRTIIHFLEPIYLVAESRKPIFVFDDNTAQFPTQEHTDLPGSNRAYYKGTNTGSTSVLTPKESINKEPPARVIDIEDQKLKMPTKSKKQEYANWTHPILFTILVVLLGLRRAMTDGIRGLSPDQRFIFDRAQLEIEHPNEQTSGVDWQKWNRDRTGREWQQMHTDLREHIAKTQITPYLEDRTTMQSEPTPKPPTEPPKPQLNGDELEQMAAKLRLSPAPDEIAKRQPPDELANLLPPDELAILERAKNKAQARVG